MPKEKQTTSRVIVFNGADDLFVTAEQEAAMDSAMTAANVDYNYVTYEGVKHSFTNPDADSLGKKFELPLSYNKEADQKSWDRMRKFFDKTFE